MIEPEIAFADLEADADLAEEMIKYIFRDVLEKAPEEMEFCNEWVDKGLIARIENVINNEFARISYTEAISILKNQARSLNSSRIGGLTSKQSMSVFWRRKYSRSPSL
jgi:asparaginyl-tRNA synthetase